MQGRRRKLAAAALILLLAGCAAGAQRDREPARGATLGILVPGAASVTSEKVAYDCGDARLEAEYINAGPVALAALSIGEDFVVAASVLAASGVRYAGDRYVWWTKGEEADLYDLMQGEDAAPLHCSRSS